MKWLDKILNRNPKIDLGKPLPKLGDLVILNDNDSYTTVGIVRAYDTHGIFECTTAMIKKSNDEVCYGGTERLSCNGIGEYCLYDEWELLSSSSELYNKIHGYLTWASTSAHQSWGNYQKHLNGVVEWNVHVSFVGSGGHVLTFTNERDADCAVLQLKNTASPTINGVVFNTANITTISRSVDEY